jgi:hypothetical protein
MIHAVRVLAARRLAERARALIQVAPPNSSPNWQEAVERLV